MKLSISFALSCVFVYATVCCANVAAEETANVDVSSDSDRGTDENITDNGGSRSDEACIAQYLKEKGKLNNDFPSEKPSTLCRFTMVEVFRVVGEVVSQGMKAKLPNEADCFLSEFDKTRTVDSALAVALIRTAPNLTEEQKDQLVTNHINELKEKLKSNTGNCGVEEERFLSIFGMLFESNGRGPAWTDDSPKTVDVTTVAA